MPWFHFHSFHLVLSNSYIHNETEQNIYIIFCQLFVFLLYVLLFCVCKILLNSSIYLTCKFLLFKLIYISFRCSAKPNFEVYITCSTCFSAKGKN